LGFGISVLLFAVGALLTWAVGDELGGIALDTVGVTLMIAGGMGAVLAVLVGRMTREREVADRDRDGRPAPLRSPRGDGLPPRP
jgi:hypothetical protein